MSTQLPPIAAVLQMQVADYARWRPAFDAGASARKAAGALGHHVNRGADDGNSVAVYLPAVDRARLETFLADDALRARMREAGVMGTPSIMLVTPAEDATVHESGLASAIISHGVADYARWKAAFDAHAPARVAAGVVGHAVNRSANDPSTVVVYLQARSRLSLENLTSSPELKAAMKDAGVTTPPTIAFTEGQDWAQY